MALAVIAYLSRSASMEIAMRYEMSEAAAAFAMLGAVVSIGVWISFSTTFSAMGGFLP
jgi:hypothetical protein